MPEPMKPCEAWALVNNETGKISSLSLIRTDNLELKRLRNRDERLARVRIVEVEEPKP